jgi:hypothetical protein
LVDGSPCAALARSLILLALVLCPSWAAAQVVSENTAVYVQVGSAWARL